MGYCYKCDQETEWLAPDGRCGDCTGYTPETITGDEHVVDEYADDMYYFTFCTRHEHLADCYVQFSGAYNEARTKMVSYFGIEWAFQYDESDYEDAVARFHLRELAIPDRINEQP